MYIHCSTVKYFLHISQLVKKFGSEHRVCHDQVPLEQRVLRALLKGHTGAAWWCWDLSSWLSECLATMAPKIIWRWSCTWASYHGLVTRHSSLGFHGPKQNSWLHHLWQVAQALKHQNIPVPSHYHYHVWQLVWCSYSRKLCLAFNGTRLPKSSTFNFQVFCLATLPWIPFSPSLFLMVKSWMLTISEANEACRSLLVCLSSWMSYHHRSKFSPFGVYSSHCIHWSHGSYNWLCNPFQADICYYCTLLHVFRAFLKKKNLFKI